MKAPAFQFYAADFLMGTMLMSAESVGGYIRLLCYQWDAGSVPSEAGALARISGCGPEALVCVLAKFSMSEDGSVLKNKRMEEVRSKSEAFRAACSAAGRKGGGNPNLSKGTFKGRGKGTSKGGLNSPSPISVSVSVSEKTLGAAAPPTTDSEWLASLQDNEAYRFLSVKVQYAKMQAWCSVNKKEPTRRRFINWLNRCEKPMQGAGARDIPPVMIAP